MSHMETNITNEALQPHSSVAGSAQVDLNSPVTVFHSSYWKIFYGYLRGVKVLITYYLLQ